VRNFLIFERLLCFQEVFWGRVDSLLCLYVKVHKEINENHPIDCFTHTHARTYTQEHNKLHFPSETRTELMNVQESIKIHQLDLNISEKLTP